jgi:hypothetical protein
MPQATSFKNLTGRLPIKTYDSASYQINGGTAIAGATATAEASAFTDSVTVTGVATTDKYLAVSPRDAVVIPAGLTLVSVVPTATNTVAFTWRNTTQNQITPPAAGVWSVAVMGTFLKG